MEGQTSRCTLAPSCFAMHHVRVKPRRRRWRSARMHLRRHLRILFGLFVVAGWVSAQAQDNYEIQVYSYDTVPPGNTMVELHSNFTVEGSKTKIDGVLPTNHAEHETVEITQGFNDWFETGFYI